MIIERRKALLDEVLMLQNQLNKIYELLDKLKEECKHEKLGEKHIASCAGHRRIWIVCPDCNKTISEYYLDSDEEDI